MGHQMHTHTPQATEGEVAGDLKFKGASLPFPPCQSNLPFLPRHSAFLQQLELKWRGKGQRNLRCRLAFIQRKLFCQFAIAAKNGLERWMPLSLYLLIHPQLREISHSKVSLHIYASWSLSLLLPFSFSILSDKLLISRRENNTLNTKQFEERAERGS